MRTKIGRNGAILRLRFCRRYIERDDADYFHRQYFNNRYCRILLKFKFSPLISFFIPGRWPFDSRHAPGTRRLPPFRRWGEE